MKLKMLQSCCLYLTLFGDACKVIASCVRGAVAGVHFVDFHKVCVSDCVCICISVYICVYVYVHDYVCVFAYVSIC